MRVEPLGESAYLIREMGDRETFAVADWLNQSGLPGLIEANACYDTVGVYVDPNRFLKTSLLDVVERLPKSEAQAPKVHRVPICYEMGEDIVEACSTLGLSLDSLAQLHADVEYRCFAIGFSPGFPYLGFLPERLCGLPRRGSPRPRVPIGSVGVTGNQTGIYPSLSPGGWMLIGRTPLTMVDMADEYFPIQAGDWVKFERIAAAEFSRLEGKRL